MKVLLIRPNSKMKTTFLPLGIGYIADAARRAGYEVSMLDARLARLSPDEVIDEIKSVEPDVIGLSAMLFEKQGIIDVSDAIHRAGLISPVILGGPIVATCGEDMVKKGIVDIAVIGEGEQTFISYLQSLEKSFPPDSIPGLIYGQGGAITVNPPGPFLDDLDERMPAWDLIRPDRYFTVWGRSTQNVLKRSSKSASIFTSRGCPFGCIYCHNVFGKKFRPRSL